MIELVHRKIALAFSSTTQRLTSIENYTIFVFSIISLVIWFGNFSSLKTILPLLLVAALFLNFKIKNIIFSLLLITIFCIPFYQPNKYYNKTIILAYQLATEYKDNYVIAYGLNIHSIFLLLTVLALFRSLLIRKTHIGRAYFVYWPLILGMSVFYFSALFSSLYASAFPEVSLILLFHYLNTFFIAILIILLYSTNKINFFLIFPCILTSFVFQTVLSILQFVKQGDIGLTVELVKGGNMFYQGLDEINTLYRISGTAHNPNQYGLLVLILLIILTPYYVRKKVIWCVLIIALGILSIVLSQSRSVWIVTLIWLVAFYRLFRTYFNVLLKSISRQKIMIYAGVLLVMTMPVIIPRFLLVANTLYQGAGMAYRIMSLSEAFSAITYSPWFGFGPGTNEYVLFSFFPNGTQSTFPSAIHNGYIEMILEVGVLGVIGFLFPFYYLLRKILNKHIFINAISRRYLFIFGLGCIVCSIYFLFQPYGILEFPYLGIILGIGYVGINSSNKNA